jgi:hypothetical protein
MPLQDHEIARALEIARELAAAGVPLFLASASPTSKSGYAFPPAWESSVPDPSVVDHWRPGMALCAVGGHLCDFLDIDPRNGGTETSERLWKAGMWPNAYAQAATPSGGIHELIQPLGVGKGEVAPGVDLQGGRRDGGGRGFVFIAPTVRASKVDGIARPYRWLTEPDIPRLIAWRGEASGAKLGALLPERKTKPKPAERDDIFGEETHTTISADRTIAGKGQEVTASARKGWGEQFRYTLNRAAYTLGAYVGSGYMLEEEAAEHLRSAIRLAGFEPDEFDERWIAEGIEAGAQAPIKVVAPSRPFARTAEGEISDGSRRKDLRAYLDGTYQAPQPSIGATRSDGVHILYPGRWHTLIGFNASGKTLFALWQAITVMQAGGTVAYLHFEEMDPGGTIDRLRTLSNGSLTDDMILKQFIWLECESRWTAGALTEELNSLAQAPELVVLDGLNAAVGQHGDDVMRPESVGTYRRLFVTPAVSLGAAVLSLGHPVKDRTRQEERHSFGATGWLDEVDGVGFRMEASPTHPLCEGAYGASALYAVKDRYSQVQKHGVRHKDREAGWFYMGQFAIDGSKQELTVSLTLPGDKAIPEGGIKKGGRVAIEDDDRRVLDAVKQLQARNEFPIVRSIIALAGMRHTKVRDSLDRLTTVSQKLITLPGPRGGTAYRTNPAYSEETDSMSPFVQDDLA